MLFQACVVVSKGRKSITQVPSFLWSPDGHSILCYVVMHAISRLCCSVKRKEEYRGYQAFCGVEMERIIKHTETRWLSMQRCVDRTLSQWAALKSYFVSEDDGKAARVHKVSSQLFALLHMYL